MYHSLSQWQQDRQAACAASPPEKCNYFLLLSWWWCNTTMGEVHLVVDDNIGYVHFSFDRYCSWGERKYAVLTTCIMLFIPSRFRDSLATMRNELTKRCLWPYMGIFWSVCIMISSWLLRSKVSTRLYQGLYPLLLYPSYTTAVLRTLPTKAKKRWPSK